jgi:hypothetical protein
VLDASETIFSDLCNQSLLLYASTAGLLAQNVVLYA